MSSSDHVDHAVDAFASCEFAQAAAVDSKQLADVVGPPERDLWLHAAHSGND
jgi:hypothetical protein